MSLLSDLGTKIGVKLKELHTLLGDKFDKTGGSITGDTQIGTQGTVTNSYFKDASTTLASQPNFNAPWIYSHNIEAPDEKGTASTGIAIGRDGSINGSTDDKVSLYTQGVIGLTLKDNKNVDITNNLAVGGSITSGGTAVALQSELDLKADASQVLTDVPANAVFTDTIYTHPSTHTISEVSGLQTELDSKLNITAKAVDSDKLDGINASSFLRRDINSTMAGDLHVEGTFSVAGNILTKRYIQIIAVERDAIIKDRVNYVGDITLPFNGTIVELRAKTDSGTCLVTFKNDSQTMSQINATSSGVSTTVIANPNAPKFTPITFDTSAASGSGLTITITVQEEA